MKAPDPRTAPVTFTVPRAAVELVLDALDGRARELALRAEKAGLSPDLLAKSIKMTKVADLIRTAMKETK